MRNPNYTAGSDFRPAFVDKVVVQEGFSDTNSAITKILTGSSMVNFDFSATGESLKLAATKYPKQLTLTPAGGNRFVALNNTEAAVQQHQRAQGRDRGARTATRCGTPAAGPAGGLATHFIPPGIPGFQQAGGAAGPSGAQFDFIQHPTGDMALAESYMKKAGYSSGKCTGNCTITMVSSNVPPASDTAQVVKAQLSQLGFNVQLHPVEQAVMYTKFCSVVANEPNVCPNVGLDQGLQRRPGHDRHPVQRRHDHRQPDEQLQLATAERSDDQRRARSAAKLITDPTARAAAYGKIDDEIMAQAPAIPWLWDYEANVASSNVQPGDQRVQRAHRPGIHLGQVR